MSTRYDDATDDPPEYLRPATVGTYGQVWLDDVEYQVAPGMPDIVEDGRIAVWVWRGDDRVVQLPNVTHDPGFVVWDHAYASRSQDWKTQLVQLARHTALHPPM